jgi:hypothetical protein
MCPGSRLRSDGRAAISILVRTLESGSSISLSAIRLVALVVGERASGEFSDAACHGDEKCMSR